MQSRWRFLLEEVFVDLRIDLFVECWVFQAFEVIKWGGVELVLVKTFFYNLVDYVIWKPSSVILLKQVDFQEIILQFHSELVVQKRLNVPLRRWAATIHNLPVVEVFYHALDGPNRYVQYRGLAVSLRNEFVLVYSEAYVADTQHVVFNELGPRFEMLEHRYRVLFQPV